MKIVLRIFKGISLATKIVIITGISLYKFIAKQEKTAIFFIVGAIVILYLIM